MMRKKKSRAETKSHTKAKRRPWPPSRTQLDALIADAIVDAYDDSEQRTGFYTMIDNNLALPFETAVLGVPVTVARRRRTDPSHAAGVPHGKESAFSTCRFRNQHPPVPNG